MLQRNVFSIPMALLATDLDADTHAGGRVAEPANKELRVRLAHTPPRTSCLPLSDCRTSTHVSLATTGRHEASIGQRNINRRTASTGSSIDEKTFVSWVGAGKAGFLPLCPAVRVCDGCGHLHTALPVCHYCCTRYTTAAGLCTRTSCWYQVTRT